MKYIDKKIEEYKDILAVESALKKFISYDYIRQLYIDFMYEAGYFNELEFEIEYIIGDRVKFKSHIPYYVKYETIADKINEIGSNMEVKWRIRKEVKLHGLLFYIEDFVAATLPQEEIDILTGLGKTVVEVTHAKTKKVIFCPTAQNEGAPF